MTNNKKGISLIVLIITIIVIIILAGAVILSLNNTNVIKNANEAVKQNDIDAANSALTLALGNQMVLAQNIVKIKPSTTYTKGADDAVSANTTGIAIIKGSGVDEETTWVSFASMGLDAFKTITVDANGKITNCTK